MNTRDIKATAKLIGIMLILYAPFWMMFKAHGDTLEYILPHEVETSPYAATMARQWPGVITIDITAMAEPFRSMIEHAAWQWSERIGRKIVVTKGTGKDGFSTSGKITFIADLALPLSIAGRTELWAWPDTGNIAGAVVKINPMALNYQQTITHEMGHAIGGIGHTASPHDVMFPTQMHSRYSLSAADVAHVPYNADSCFVELMRDNSLYIPQFRGMAALLKYDGTGWKLTEYVPSKGQCTTVAAIGMDITFGDIRTPGRIYRAQLRYVGGERWILESAE